MVTFCLNGQRSNASYSPRVTTKNSDRCVPLPMPSPFDQVQAGAHFVSMVTGVETRAINGSLYSGEHIVSSPSNLSDFPQQGTIIGGELLLTGMFLHVCKDDISEG